MTATKRPTQPPGRPQILKTQAELYQMGGNDDDDDDVVVDYDDPNTGGMDLLLAVGNLPLRGYPSLPRLVESSCQAMYGVQCKHDISPNQTATGQRLQSCRRQDVNLYHRKECYFERGAEDGSIL